MIIIVTAMMIMMWMCWCRARAGSTHANHKVAAGRNHSRITIAIVQKCLAWGGDDTRYLVSWDDTNIIVMI